MSKSVPANPKTKCYNCQKPHFGWAYYDETRWITSKKGTQVNPLLCATCNQNKKAGSEAALPTNTNNNTPSSNSSKTAFSDLKVESHLNTQLEALNKRLSALEACLTRFTMVKVQDYPLEDGKTIPVYEIQSAAHTLKN